MIHVDDFGRSLKISKDILKKIKKGTVSRVSVMIGFVDKSMHLELKKTKILFRLHLNLTEQVEYFSKDFKSMTFLSLLFANKRKKSLIKEEIDRQLKEFKVMYSMKKVRLDGHQHVHFIPWIYKYLCNNPVCNIQELRYPVEPFHIVKLRFLFNRQFLRNIVAMTVLKIFSMFNKRRTDYSFFGVLYTNLYDESVLEYQKKNFSNFKQKEILLHIGRAEANEKSLFSPSQFAYNSSKQRTIEANLV